MRPNIRSPFGLVAILCSCLLLIAAGVAVLDSLEQGEKQLIQRQYAAAVTSLEKAVAEGADGHRDRALLLLGRARLLAGDAPGAVRAFEQLLREESGSELRAMAAFQKAEALARQGQHREAAVLYREEISRLIGLDRKERIAETYLSLAEKARAATPPDHGRAVVFFDLALDLGLPVDSALTVKLLAAESLAERGDRAGAVARLEPLLGSLTVAQGKLRGMLIVGRCKRLLGNGAGARTVLRDLRRDHRDTAEAADAAYEIALSYGVPTPSEGMVDRAVGALDELRTAHPDHPKARLARFLVAQCEQHVGRSDAALATLRRFVDEQADSGLEELAAARAMMGDILASQGKREAAIVAWRAYLSAHPAHREWERVQRAIVDAEYGAAEEARAEGVENFEDARARYAKFASDYPLDERNPDILLALGSMLAAEEKHEEAIVAFARCVSKYPGKEASSRAQFLIGDTYERHVFHYEKALEAYRGVTWGRWVRQAQARIGRLERKSLALRTPRVFHTAEPASFEITSRNIETLRVRVFRLDLEDYFRATHTAGDVERLDIEVIAPDKVFDSTVADYQKYRESKRDVTVGLEGPGAYVVKVDDRELEATTMVLVSDIAMIAKSSRHEFFVFTQNTRDSRVAPGVKVVLSDGARVVAEGTTDEQGVWRYEGEALSQHDRLGVFCVSADGSGASNLDLSGLGYTQGLVAKGYLYTDRPAYQPGQAVNIKGIVREAEGGLYRLPKADGYQLQVLSAGGRLVLQQAIEFTPFGTFVGTLDLPADAALGAWRVVVASEDEVRFTGSFEVARQERPRMTLSAALDRPVVFRGEPVKGRFELEYFFGEPAVGKRIEYFVTLPDGGRLRREGETNAAGEFAFEFSTDDFAEEALAAVEARVLGENVSVSLVVPVVTTEFVPSVSTVRDVYLAGEALRAQVRLRGRSGEPLARKGEAVLLRLVDGKPQLAEVEVGRTPFATDASGAAEVSFTAAAGGLYRIRVEAVDRFDNLVTATHMVVVSGDDDEIKLRLLSDRDRYEVGEVARVEAVNRAGARLVLQTVQGDGILAHRAFVLPAGTSTIEVPLEALHAPNFALALAMVDGAALHTAEKEFRVSRDLRITVTPSAEKVAPGAEVELRVEARDPQGRPVAAEVALALVDNALLAVHPDGTPAIGAFFYGTLRETGFRTRSSCAWSYAGKTRSMSEALLAEEARREFERFEEAPAGEAAPDDGSADFFMAPAVRDMPSAAAGLLRDLQSQQRQQQQQGGQQSIQVMSVQNSLGGELASQLGAFVQDENLGYAATRFAFDMDSEGLVDANAAMQRRDVSSTGAWIAAAVTGADGSATVKLTMPEAISGWTLVGRGVTADTWVGEGRAQLRTSRELQVDLVGPPVLTEGDRTPYGVRVHNLTGDQLGVAVATTVRAGEAADERSEQIAVRGGAEAELPLAVVAGGHDLRIGAVVQSGARSDGIEREIQVQPFGREFRAGAAGVTKERARFELGLPTGREFRGLSMEIELGPDPGADLFRAVVGRGSRPSHCVIVDRTQLGLAARGMMALELLAALERGRGVTPGERVQLMGIVRGALTALVSAQSGDGSYGFVRNSGQDVRTTAQALRFFAAAKAYGLEEADAGAQRAGEWLLERIRRMPVEQRADALWALATVGRASFEALNSLHRARNGLSQADAARLALAWQAAQRPEVGDEALAVLRPMLETGGSVDPEQLEAMALSVRALLARNGADRDGTRGLQWLGAQRRGATWGTPTATAAAVSAMLQGTVLPAGGELTAGEIEVAVNGRALGTVPRESVRETTLFEVPADWLREQGNTIEVVVKGGATAHYVATLTGFSAGFDDADQNRDRVRVTRTFEADFRHNDNKPVPRGFSVVEGRYSTFRNLLTQMRVGEVCRAQVSFHVRREEDQKRISPVVVEEPIPAGCTVPRGSISGSFDHVDVEPHRLVFYYRPERVADTVSYELQARFAGTFRVLPTKVYGALRPDVMGYGAPGAMTVHARGEGAQDEYRLTPDELYHLGRGRFEAGDLPGAATHLEALLAEWHGDKVQLRGDVFKEVARMMLFASIAKADSPAVVRFFEELKDRFEDLVIPFDKIVEVGRAYLDIGEFESALLVFRATAEASFLKDAAVATTLEQSGELKSSVQFLQRLLLDYPDLNTMRMSLYGIAQQLAQWAAERQPEAPVDPRVGSVAELREQAVRALREFLVFFPEDPLAEEVSFAWATTLLEGVDLEGALRVAEAAIARYPGCVFEDELLYTKGYALFARGEHEPAFAALEQVAEGSFTQPSGGTGPSENRFHAIYLQGQIHHARGEAAEALAAYEQVLDRFSDAGEASDYFKRKGLALPEITSLPLEDPVELDLEFRNVETVDVQVFKVDLMRLYLLEKSLNDIRGIQLHGIKPLRQVKMELGNGRDYRTKTQRIPLELPEPGAYLVVVRGGDQLASGMVLRTNLEIEAQEQTDVGRVRVNVKRDGAFVGEVHVKVVGSQDGTFQSGNTDLRGVFTATGLIGKATIIASIGDQFAFFRGDDIHQPQSYVPELQQLEQVAPERNGQWGEGEKAFGAFDNNFMLNGSNRGRQVRWLQDEVKLKQQLGVEVYRTK